MNLTDILTPECIKAPLTGQSKEQAINELIDLLADSAAISDREAAIQAVLDREKIRTTGVGNGLAIPHGKCTAAKELVMALGKADKPINFDSVDGQGVSLVVLLVSPQDKTGPHIQALARISRLFSMETFRKKLLAASNAQEIYDAIKEREETT